MMRDAQRDGLKEEGLSRAFKVRLVTFLIMAGFGFGVIYHFWVGAYLAGPPERATYLFPWVDKMHTYPEVTPIGTHSFGDFSEAYIYSTSPSPYLRPNPNSRSNYFPFAHWTMAPLLIFDRITAIYAYLLIVVTGVWLFTRRYFKTGDWIQDLQTPMILTLFLYPLQFTLDRGNLEGLLLLYMFGFWIQYRKESYSLAAFFLACAGAMKLYPLLLLGLFVSERRYRDVLKCLAWTVTLAMVPLFFYAGGFVENLYGLIGAVFTFTRSIGVGTYGIVYGSSLYGSLYMLLGMVGGFGSYQDPGIAAAMNSFYMPLALTLGAGIGVTCLLPTTRRWQRITLLIIAMNLLPKTSFDYRMVSFLVVLAAFVNAKTSEFEDLTIGGLLGLLLIPKHYIEIDYMIGLGPILNPWLMLSIVAIIARQNWLESREQISKEYFLGFLKPGPELRK